MHGLDIVPVKQGPNVFKPDDVSGPSHVRGYRLQLLLELRVYPTILGATIALILEIDVSYTDILMFEIFSKILLIKRFIKF